jgi:hypothetical protein
VCPPGLGLFFSFPPVLEFVGTRSASFSGEVSVMITKLLLIFLAGFVIDLLITKYTSDVAEKRIWRATLFSGMITMANFLLLTVILKDSAMDGMFNILAFAGGNSLGTFFAMKRT